MDADEPGPSTKHRAKIMTAAEIWERAGPWIVASMFGAAAMVLMVTAVLLEPEDFRPAMVEVCDDAVAALLKTKDMVEFERSKFLIQKLRCRLRTRLESTP
jgi:hypothetical protein